MKETIFTIRNYSEIHYEEVKALMQACFSDMDGAYATAEELALLSQLYPQGQILFFVEDELVAANFSRIVPFEKYRLPHTQFDCANLDVFLDDALNGDSVYGLDVIVKPEYQSGKIGKRIVQEFIDRVFSDNFAYMLGISRIVNYHKFADSMTAIDYALRVKTREIADPVLGFHLSYGCEIIGDSPEFNALDKASAGEGIIIGVKNVDYKSEYLAKHVQSLQKQYSIRQAV